MPLIITYSPLVDVWNPSFMGKTKAKDKEKTLKKKLYTWI